MSLGLIGKKLGMTHVYDDDGVAIPVTVLDVRENTVVQIKTQEKDGYSGVQIGVGDQKAKRKTKAEVGHCKKHGAEPKRRITEFRFDGEENLPESGQELKAGLFQEGQFVDLIGVTKGKGFQGVYKRFGFGGLPATHGSMMHRRPGGIGCGTTPGRVWKNANMPGREGGRRRTTQNLQVVKVREDDNVLLIRGSVPGSKGSYVLIRPAKKKPLPESK